MGRLARKTIRVQSFLGGGGGGGGGKEGQRKLHYTRQQVERALLGEEGQGGLVWSSLKRLSEKKRSPKQQLTGTDHEADGSRTGNSSELVDQSSWGGTRQRVPGDRRNAKGKKEREEYHYRLSRSNLILLNRQPEGGRRRGKQRGGRESMR